MRVSRRTKGAGAALAVLCSLSLAACGGDSDSGGATSSATSSSAASGSKELVVTSFGGDFEKAQQKALFSKFEQKYGVKVRLVTMYSADALAKLTAARGNSGLDVVQFSGGQEAQAASDDLIEKVDPTKIPNAAEVYPQAKDPGYAPAYAFDATGIIYRNAVAKPTSWSALADAKYKGKVAIPDISTTYGVQMLLKLADIGGGGYDDMKPGFAALGKVVANSQSVFKDAPTMVQLLTKGDADLAVYDAGYGYLMHQQGLPVSFTIPSEGSYLSKISMNVVAGTKNADLAQKLIDMALDPTVQSQFATAAGYGPTNTKATLDASAKPFLVTSDTLGRLSTTDDAKVAANRPAWTSEWNKVIAK